MAPNLRLRVLPQIFPVDGREIELRTSGGFIQWRYVTDHNGQYVWTDLYALADLIGPAGPAIELRSNGTYIQFRVVGSGEDGWTNVVPLTDLKGAQGDAGPKGDPGDNSIDSRAYAIASYHPQSFPNKIQTAGYALPGDGGGALYKKVNSQPSHAAKFSITLADNITVVWYELAETIIRPEMIGAVGDGSTNDQAALYAAFLLGQKVILSRHYALNDWINLAKPNLTIEAINGAKITYTGAHNFAPIWLTTVLTLIVTGRLEIDCNSKTNSGLVAIAATGADLIDIGGLVARNMRGVTGFGAVCGILVYTQTGAGDVLNIHDCQVINGTRVDDSLPIQLISANDFKVINVTDCFVDGARRNATGLDCDGIVVFQDAVSGVFDRGSIHIGNNLIKNSSGRFVKVQSRGWAEMVGCTCVNDDVTLPYLATSGVYSLDFQTGGGSIRDVQIEYQAPTIGTISTMVFVTMSLSGGLPYTGAPIVMQVKDVNVTYAGGTKTPESGVTIALAPLATEAYQVIVDVDSIHMVKTTGWGNGAVCGNAIDLLVPTAFAAGADAVVRLTNNTIDASQFMRQFPAAPGGTAAHNGAGDLSAGLELHVLDNASSDTSSSSIISWVNNQCFTSKIKIRGNSIGVLGNRWNAPFDFAEILPGCDFITGAAPTPALAGAPASSAFAMVHFNGFKTVDDSSKTVYVSGTGTSTTWTTRIYT